jgi:hypothetical protein
MFITGSVDMLSIDIFKTSKLIRNRKRVSIEYKDGIDVLKDDFLDDSIE